jgi:choline dehydrogenase-like flavoprotein/predicted dehydrogenase
MIIDFCENPSTDHATFDVCVVGSGPVGISIALAFAGRSERVLLLESGGDGYEPGIERLSSIEVAGHRRAHPSSVRRRIFGGTSSVWSGRCMAFDILDFQSRSWMPYSGWPIHHDELEPWVASASRFLQAGPFIEGDRVWAHLGARPPVVPWDSSKFITQVFQPSVVRHQRSRHVPPPNDPNSGSLQALQHSSAPSAEDLGEHARETIRTSSNITLMLHAHVTEVLTDDSGRLATGVRLRSLKGGGAVVKARRVVLACGGIDNARLLLLSVSKNHPLGLGNQHDQVGRYLCDHHYASIGVVRGNRAREIRRRMGWRWYRSGIDRYLYLMGISLSRQRQIEEELPRSTAFLFEYPIRAAPLSSAARVLRRIRGRSQDGGLADLENVLGHPMELLRSAVEWRFRGWPPLVPVDHVDIGCNVEQIPDPESRVTLGRGTDDFGQPVARVDWRLHEREFEGYRRTAELFSLECRRLGLPVPVPSDWLASGSSGWRAPLHDMAHPMGATRMCSDPKRGVVDRHCAVYGVDQLFIAGSSVFPTGGTSNPTLLAVALAQRLAGRLQQTMTSAPIEIRTQSGPMARVRVGLVGAGHRVQLEYLPVFRSLSDRIEIVGIATRSEASARRAAESFGCRAWGSAVDLVQEGQPELVVAIVPGEQNVSVVHQLIALGVPVLSETPVAWTKRAANGVVAHARSKGVPVGIAEQFPFLPIECLKRKLISLGAIGTVIAAANDFASYDYHGIAQLRAAIGEAHPATAVSARRFGFGLTGVPEGQKPATAELGWDETWIRADIQFAGGALAVHQYSSGYAVLPTRPRGSLKVYGTSGTIVDEHVIFVDRRTGSSTSQDVLRTESRGDESKDLESLSIAHPALGEVVWMNPFHGFSLSEEQIAIAQHVLSMANCVRRGGVPLYTAAQAAEDIAVLEAINESADRKGARIALPRNGLSYGARRAFSRMRARVLGAR